MKQLYTKSLSFTTDLITIKYRNNGDANSYNNNVNFELVYHRDTV